MDPETKLLTDLLTRGVLSVEQFAAEMARRSGFQPSNPRLGDGLRARARMEGSAFLRAACAAKGYFLISDFLRCGEALYSARREQQGEW